MNIKDFLTCDCEDCTIDQLCPSCRADDIAVDIFNAWNFGIMAKDVAIGLFSMPFDDIDPTVPGLMLIDFPEKTGWVLDRIWKNQGLG